MAILHIRNVPEQLYASLVDEAKGKKISLTEHVNNIIRMHTMLPELDYMNSKYKNLMEEERKIYKETLAENQRLLKKLDESNYRIEDLLNENTRVVNELMDLMSKGSERNE